MIMNIIEELVECGIEKIVIIVQPDDLDQFNRFFKLPVSANNAKLLTTKGVEQAKKVSNLGKHVKFVIQEKQSGFGHAVLCAKDEIGENESFILALGHHVYKSNDRHKSCVHQLLEAYETVGINTIGLKMSPIDDVSKFGTIAGTAYSVENRDIATHLTNIMQLVNVTKVVEKPTIDFAKSNLRVFTP